MAVAKQKSECPDCGEFKCVCESDDAEFQGRRVFSNCNVCGRKLHNVSEEAMGMCAMCAAE